ncbi:MAG TPA: thioredoxin domain-containing protein [Thermoanaerobaculia bacterium]|nr:thioredoxin domain-containing protein [Thermoanaerobaculia bacterium]
MHTKRNNPGSESLFCVPLLALALAWPAAAQQQTERPNRLIHEKSPYLLQHARNPVDWYPWGEEAFEKARAEDKPIFLSIGYSTCHWCHVMEEESFADAEVAGLMNETFVSIKVDREERPDIDQLYITVAQMITGEAGWPLNVLLTPDRKPFFAATYIPKGDRFGRPGMLSLLPRIARLWHEQREHLLASADLITTTVLGAMKGSPGESPPPEILGKGYDALAARFDEATGGFLPAPKFPSAHSHLFLLRYWKRSGETKALRMVETSLEAMRRGGIWDHAGFGFHRYATDARWLVPHFEKMLYDQAMLAMAYTEAWQATGKPLYRRTAEEIFEYVLRDMRSPRGGFYSAEDAASDGEAGKFYLWTEQELRSLLGRDAALFIEAYGVRKEGNFRDELGEESGGRNILHLPRPLEEIALAKKIGVESLRGRLERNRQKLLEARRRRARPHRDDKILTDWNGLMIAALAKGTQAFGEERWARAARQAADFLLATMRTKEGRLLHRYRDGEAGIDGQLDDYAFLIWGLLELYEATWEIDSLQAAVDLAGEAIARFEDPDAGGFFMTAHDGEPLLARPKPSTDAGTPAGNAVMMLDLLRIGRITANPDYEKKAEGVARAFAGDLSGSPGFHAAMLSALDFAFGPSFEIVVAGDPSSPKTRAMLGEVVRPFLPRKVVLLRPAGEESPPITRLAPYTELQRSIGGKPTVYVCTNYHCKMPTTDPGTMRRQLGLHP